MRLKQLIILVLVVFFSLFFLGLAPAEEHQEEFEKVLPLSSGGTFNLKNVNGEVTVSTWKEDRVEIRALKKTNKAAENLQKVKIEVTASPGLVSVETVYPKLRNTGVRVDYKIKVPEGVNLGELRSVNGNIGITGLFARVSAGTTNGRVHLENASGDLKLETTNGDLEAINVNGPVDAHTTNGSIALELSKLEADVRAETTNGGITLRLSATGETNATLEAETVNGSILLDFPVTLQSLEKSRHHLRGRIGRGGARISLETVNGSIRLTR
jgi:DUF4097 and DUF4098 domain-containing protein YvlB